MSVMISYREVCFLGNPAALAASPAARAVSKADSLALLQRRYHDAYDLKRSRHHKQVHVTPVTRVEGPAA
jgi:hypothetical protein